ncbi:MAG: BamA/TamA family outer membrane protein [Cyanobacteria bacterium P01_A01_bin.68]
MRIGARFELILGSELHIRVLKTTNSQLKLIPFVDFGNSWNNSRNDERIVPQKLGSLLSVGLGIEYELGDKLNARLDWGIPLIEDNTNNDSDIWQNGIYLSLRYQPF